MTDALLNLREHFPPHGREEWLALVEKELKGAPPEKLARPTRGGLPRQVLYTREDAALGEAPGLPGLAPHTRGNRRAGTAAGGWELRQQIADADPAAARVALLEDLANGVDGLALKLDGGAWLPGEDPLPGAAAGAAGHAPAGVGLVLGGLAELSRLLEGIDPAKTALHVSTGGLFLPGAALLAAWWRSQGRAAGSAPPRGSLQADPLGALAAGGALAQSAEAALAQAAALAVWSHQHLPGVPALRVSTAPVHDAGGNTAQELGTALATGLAYLRALEAAGLPPEQAAGQIAFDVALDTELFPTVAALRALRRCWARVLEACGVPAAGRRMPQLSAHLGWRCLTARDPHGNLLRGTAAAVGAVLGGAEALLLRPHDQAVDGGSRFARRLARNTQHLLREESQLHRVIDPLGGSWYGEALTAQAAEAAWTVLQQIEAKGGMLAVLRSGGLQAQVAASAAERQQAVATRQQAVVGVSEFADPGEAPAAPHGGNRAGLRAGLSATVPEGAKAALDALRTALAAGPITAESVEALVQALAAGAPLRAVTGALLAEAQGEQVTALAPLRWAEPWEALRAASDAAGTRPTAWLACIGGEARHGARAGFTRGVLEAAGIAVQAHRGAETPEAALAAAAQAAAPLAVICGDDEDYPGWVPVLAAGLKQAGARTVLLAGRAGGQEAVWREAGVEAFIYRGADLLATVRQVLAAQGVSP